MKWSMDRVQRGGPWTGSTGVVHGPRVNVLYTSFRKWRIYQNSGNLVLRLNCFPSLLTES